VTCSERPLDCAMTHVLPLLRDVRCIRQGQWSAQCPACGHTSLSLATGSRGQRLVWTCHRKPACSQEVVRNALRARGVPAGCLPRVPSPGYADSLPERDRLIQIVTADLPPATRILLLGAELLTSGKIPAGRELDALAARIRLGRGTVYRARHAQIPPDMPESQNGTREVPE